MKFLAVHDELGGGPVAPRAGAWIEMVIWTKCFISQTVAPRAGAWIEMPEASNQAAGTTVAPRAGAWIEIL